MRFGITIGYSGATLALDMPLIQEAGRLGFHSVWSTEAYGSDVVTPLAWSAPPPSAFTSLASYDQRRIQIARALGVPSFE